MCLILMYLLILVSQNPVVKVGIFKDNHLFVELISEIIRLNEEFCSGSRNLFLILLSLLWITDDLERYSDGNATFHQFRQVRVYAFLE